MTIVTETVETHPGLQFSTDIAGDPGADFVLLLHGFPESRHIWRETVPLLSGAGYRAAAPDQRGYSAGARPDPADLSNYTYDRLVRDALDLADACGAVGRRFHLVGHDWGAQIAWSVASRHPERLASLTILSRPHPMAFRAAMADPDGDQAYRSRHHKAFLQPTTADLMMADGALRFRRMLAAQNVPNAAIDAHLSVIDGRDALEATLAWYRANDILLEMGSIATPTLYIWGDADATVGPKAALATKQFVTGPFHMEVIPGAGHFMMDEAAGRISELVLAHIAANPT
ncbi:MAG: alpha/beta hydrolase [Hyphomicrobiales bacterium]|nr:alpha/beta hydrolase [Hyphomicrobiales bacterium]